MKRLLAVLSVALLVVGFTACGGKKAEETTPQNPPAEQAKGEEAAQPAEQAAPQEEQKPAEQAAPQEEQKPAEQPAQPQGGEQGGETPMGQ